MSRRSGAAPPSAVRNGSFTARRWPSTQTSNASRQGPWAFATGAGTRLRLLTDVDLERRSRATDRARAAGARPSHRPFERAARGGRSGRGRGRGPCPSARDDAAPGTIRRDRSTLAAVFFAWSATSTSQRPRVAAALDATRWPSAPEHAGPSLRRHAVAGPGSPRRGRDVGCAWRGAYSRARRFGSPRRRRVVPACRNCATSPGRGAGRVAKLPPRSTRWCRTRAPSTPCTGRDEARIRREWPWPSTPRRCPPSGGSRTRSRRPRLRRDVDAAGRACRRGSPGRRPTARLPRRSVACARECAGRGLELRPRTPPPTRARSAGVDRPTRTRLGLERVDVHDGAGAARAAPIGRSGGATSARRRRASASGAVAPLAAQPREPVA